MDYFQKTPLVSFCLLSSTPSPFWKGIISEKKEFALKESKFFLFRVDSFSYGKQNNFELLPPLKVYWFFLHALKK